MKIKSYSLFIVLLVLLASCASRKNIVYFQPQEMSVKSDNAKDNVTILKEGDLLYISISSTNLEAAKPFNLLSSTNNTTNNSQLQNYLISESGVIELPVIGKVEVAGLTTEKAKELIKTKLKEYLVDPIVIVRLLNFKVTVLGEVKKPGTYSVSNESITLLEALGLAGDITIYGKRTNVLIIRENDGVRNKIRIDLTSDKLFESDVYYLKQNDVVYVEPNKTRTNSSTIGTSTSVMVSVISSLITLAIVLFR